MNIAVNSNAEGTEYCLHNLPLTVFVHNPRESGEFFVFRAKDETAKVCARLFFSRTELENLRAQIDQVLEQGPRAETGIKVEACTT